MIFSCKVGNNVSEGEAIYCAVSFESKKCTIGTPERVLSDKVLVLNSVKIMVEIHNKWVRSFLFTHAFPLSLKPALVEYCTVSL